MSSAVKGAGPVAQKQTGAPQAAAKQKLRVHTKITGEEARKLQILLGDFVETSNNHGRPVYHKAQKPNVKDSAQVFLYYWDDRDGAESAGWWFGDQVGGTQVWSRAMSDSKAPPREGWKIPWDGDAVKDMLLVDVLPQQTAPGTRSASSRPQAAAPESSSERKPPPLKAEPAKNDVLVNEYMQQVDELEIEVQQVLVGLEQLLGSEETDVLKEVQAQLQRCQEKCAARREITQKHIDEESQNGSSATASALNRLLGRLGVLDKNLAGEATKVRMRLAKVERMAETEKKEQASREELAQTEKRDAQLLHQHLPEAMELVQKAEEAVETMSILAAPLVPGGLEESLEMQEAEAKTMEEVDQAGLTAQQAHQEAKSVVLKRMSELKNFAPEAKKVATTEYKALLDKLSEVQKQLQTLKKQKADFVVRLANRKEVAALAEKLGCAELNLEKAKIMVQEADTQMPEDEIKAAEDLLAEADFRSILQSTDKRLYKGGGPAGHAAQLDPVSKQELQALFERGQQGQKRIEELRKSLRRQRESHQIQDYLTKAQELVEKYDEALNATTEAEMPFLKGLEVLPRQESIQTISECEAAAANAEKVGNATRKFLNDFKTDLRGLSKEGVAKFDAQFSDLKSHVADVDRKIQEFRVETQRRKVQSMIQEVVDDVTEAESLVQTLGEVSKLLEQQNLEEVSLESLKSTSEQALIAEKEATAACAKARGVLQSKQREVRDETMSTELLKLQERVGTAFQELSKHRRVANSGEKLTKNKKHLMDEEAKVVEFELAVQKVEALAAPKDDSPPTEEAVKEIDAETKTVEKALKCFDATVAVQLAGADGSLKAALERLRERAKKGLTVIQKVKEETKVQRERISCEAMLQQARQTVAEVDAALAKLEQAEAPLLKGSEALGIESMPLIKESEKVAENVAKVLQAARGFIAKKSLEVRGFAEESRVSTTAELQKLTQRNNAAGARLSRFRMDSESRKRSLTLQEAAQRLNAVEAQVKEVAKVGEPLELDGPAALSSIAAAELCSKLWDLAKAAAMSVLDTRAYLETLQKAEESNETAQESLKALLQRCQTIQDELNSTKQNGQEREQRFVAKRMLSQAKDYEDEVERESVKLKEMSSQLLEGDGKALLVMNDVAKIGEALQERIRDKGSSKDELYQQVKGESSSLTIAAFKAFIGKVLEELQRSDFDCSDEHLEAVGKQLDTDGNGEISREEFEEMFRQRFICVNVVTMTDSKEVSSKSVAKLEPGVILEALGAPVTPVPPGIPRVECKVVSTGKSGWVTMVGNRGTKYLEQQKPFEILVQKLEHQLDKASKIVTKALGFLKQKIADVSGNGARPLNEAVTEMKKIQLKCTEFKQEVDLLRKKVNERSAELIRQQAIQVAHAAEQKRKELAASTKPAESGDASKPA